MHAHCLHTSTPIAWSQHQKDHHSREVRRTISLERRIMRRGGWGGGAAAMSDRSLESAKSVTAAFPGLEPARPKPAAPAAKPAAASSPAAKPTVAAVAPAKRTTTGSSSSVKREDVGLETLETFFGAIDPAVIESIAAVARDTLSRDRPADAECPCVVCGELQPAGALVEHVLACSKVFAEAAAGPDVASATPAAAAAAADDGWGVPTGIRARPGYKSPKASSGTLPAPAAVRGARAAVSPPARAVPSPAAGSAGTGAGTPATPSPTSVDFETMVRRTVIDSLREACPEDFQLCLRFTTDGSDRLATAPRAVMATRDAAAASAGSSSKRPSRRSPAATAGAASLAAGGDADFSGASPLPLPLPAGAEVGTPYIQGVWDCMEQGEREEMVLGLLAQRELVATRMPEAALTSPKPAASSDVLDADAALAAALHKADLDEIAAARRAAEEAHRASAARLVGFQLPKKGGAVGAADVAAASAAAAAAATRRGHSARAAAEAASTAVDALFGPGEASPSSRGGVLPSPGGLIELPPYAWAMLSELQEACSCPTIAGSATAGGPPRRHHSKECNKRTYDHANERVNELQAARKEVQLKAIEYTALIGKGGGQRFGRGPEAGGAAAVYWERYHVIGKQLEAAKAVAAHVQFLSHNPSAAGMYHRRDAASAAAAAPSRTADRVVIGVDIRADSAAGSADFPALPTKPVGGSGGGRTPLVADALRPAAAAATSDLEVDLHNLTAAAAVEMLQESILPEYAAAGARFLRIITGKGSAAGAPPMKRAVAALLQRCVRGEACGRATNLLLRADELAGGVGYRVAFGSR